MIVISGYRYPVDRYLTVTLAKLKNVNRHMGH